MTPTTSRKIVEGIDEHCLQLVVLGGLLRGHPAQEKIRAALLKLYEARAELEEVPQCLLSPK